MGIGVVLNYVVPEKAFGYVTSVATAAGIWTWLMILISHVLYRRAVVAGRLPASSFPAPGGSVCSWVAIVFLLFVTCLIAYDADSRVCLYVMAGWAVALGIGWAVLKCRNPEITDRREPEFEKAADEDPASGPGPPCGPFRTILGTERPSAYPARHADHHPGPRRPDRRPRAQGPPRRGVRRRRGSCELGPTLRRGMRA